MWQIFISKCLLHHLQSPPKLVDVRTRGHQNVLYHSFRYTLNKKKGDNCYWKCVEKTCKGKLNISGGTTITGRQQVKRKSEQTSEPSKKPIRNLVGDLSWEAKAKILVDEAFLKKSVQRARVNVSSAESTLTPQIILRPLSFLLPTFVPTPTNPFSCVLWDSDYDMVHRRTLLFGTN